MFVSEPISCGSVRSELTPGWAWRGAGAAPAGEGVPEMRHSAGAERPVRFGSFRTRRRLVGVLASSALIAGSLALVASAIHSPAFAVTSSSIASGSPASVQPADVSTAYATAVLADSPSVFWRLNDLQAGTAADSSGHGVSGTYESVARQVPGALISDPNDGAIDVTRNSSDIPAVQGNDSTLPSGKAPRTVEFWENVVQCGCYPGLLFSYGGSDSFSISMPGDYHSVQIDDGSSDLQLHAPVDFNVTGWHMFDISYDGTSATAYVDGQEIGSGPLSANTVPSGSGLTLWRNTQTNVYYDDMAVYPSALGPTSVEQHWSAAASPGGTTCATSPTSAYAQSVLGDDPSAYYRLDDLGAGGGNRVAFDNSGNCLNGAYEAGGEVPGAISSDPNHGALGLSRAANTSRA